MEVVKKMEQVGTGDGEPICPVKIVDCGETSETKIQAASQDDKGIRLLWLVIEYFFNGAACLSVGSP